MTRRALIAAALIAALAAPLAGCTVNPATGEQSFTGTMGTAEEIRLGSEQHPKVIKTFNGIYGTPALGKYVDGVGQLLARTSERRGIKYHFTVLNSPAVNAFALPGGYIYITRGLLALAGNEAELAAVLAHELGHVNALHHAQRAGQNLLASVLVTGLGIAGGRIAADTSAAVAQGLLRSFSREHEYESDDLGIRYMVRAGYDPLAMAAFLRKLRAESRLQARLRNESPDKIDQFNYLATHPAPIERVRRAEATARGKRRRDAMLAEDIYLGKIDGILYGDDPRQGFVRGRVFSHPARRFRFEAPPGFRLFNSEKSVVALGPRGVRILFDQAHRRTGASMKHYLTRIWAPGAGLDQVATIDINGLEAATGTTRRNTSAGMRDIRLVAIRVDRKTIYRFLFLTPPAETRRWSAALRRTTYSFRLLSEAEARLLRPLRLRIHRAVRGDTVRSLAQRMAFDELRLERFEVLNGLARNAALAPGRPIKIVTE